MKTEYEVKIIGGGSTTVIKPKPTDRVCLRLDNTIIDVEINYSGTPLINIYPYNNNVPVTGIVVNELTHS